MKKLVKKLKKWLNTPVKGHKNQEFLLRILMR